MKRFETTVEPARPAVERQRCIGLACDLCGLESRRADRGWADAYYEINDTEVSVTVKRTSGQSWPGSGHETTLSIDICPACFKGKLIPWLKSQGATVRKEEIDW